jgi:[citrate (pro-3S)-lyase] ligase
MAIIYGAPFSGAALECLTAFLAACGLGYDDKVGFSVCITDGGALERGHILGAGSLDGNVLKCIAVSPDAQNEGIAASVVTELVKKAASQGLYHLFLFTKPEHGDMFESLGFYAIAQTDEALLMENKKDGISRFVEQLRKTRPVTDGAAMNGITGSIVANCNPFTKGHLYLCETAASLCETLHLFILSEEKSEFPAEARCELAQKGCAHIPNIIVQPTGPYLISAATFPDYFLKKSASSEQANMKLDLAVFAERIAQPLGITRRFVGTEPFSPLTNRYNRAMRETLPRYGIEVTEIPRIELDGEAVSASRVRSLIAAGKIAALKNLVPETTYEYITQNAAALGTR